MSDTVKLIFVLLLFAVLAVYMMAQPFDSNEEAWAAFKRWIAKIPERLRALYAAATRERAVGIEVALPPRAVLDRAVEAMTRSRMHALEARSENSLTFVRREKPSTFAAIFLLLLFILPGILYLMFGSRMVRATLAVFAGEAGGSRIVVGGDDRWTVARLTEWARGLRLEPAGTEAAEVDAPDNPIDQIRRLAELRDAGLVTPEEFEAKRKDLLDRM